MKTVRIIAGYALLIIAVAILFCNWFFLHPMLSKSTAPIEFIIVYFIYCSAILPGGIGFKLIESNR